MIKPVITSFTLILMLHSNLFAQGHADHGGHDTKHGKHHIAIFDGLATNFDHETSGYSLGLDYEYKISSLVGTGVIGEYVFSGEGEFILGVPVFVHPTNNLKVMAAPIGVYAEKHHYGHYDDSHGTISNSVEREWHIGVRLNLGYSIHLGKISTGPSVSLDVTNTIALVYGLSFGIGF